MILDICGYKTREMKPTLLVLAAGMGSRYGGLKQMDAFGPSGETLLDYSIYDAIEVGFGKVVFVIRESFNEAFREFFKGKFEDLLEVEFVYQEIHDVPEGAVYDKGREKPWGTAHAVWVARHVVHEPFVVINADDFYGRGAYMNIYNHFKTTKEGAYSLVGYNLLKTMSDHGTVNRGVCTTDENDKLESIVETLKIGFDDNKNIVYPDGEGISSLSPDTVVSMNFWGFHPDYFDYCGAQFKEFLNKDGHKPKSEFFIPLLVEHLIATGEKEVDVVNCDEEWFGVTYQEDKPFVQDRILDLIEKGVYAKNLWNKTTST